MTGLESECVNPLLSAPDPSRPLEKAKQRLLHFYNRCAAVSFCVLFVCVCLFCFLAVLILFVFGWFCFFFFYVTYA
jgi:hypothetical protein